MLRAWSTVTICLALGLLPRHALAQDARSYDKVSFYFAAHEDDWQLFMNPSAFADVTNDKAKAVFIHVTAGDAGLGTGSGGRKHPYYLARENGAENAIRFMADAGAMPVETTTGRVPFNGHPVYRARYRNTVAYFLRLPDGSPSGSGFAGTGFESLKRLASGDEATIAAIDGSTAYQGWTDLVATVRAIVDQERGRAPLVQLNVAEIDPAINPNDHSDHLMTAKAALDAATGLTCATRAYYVDYASAGLPENLSAQQREIETSVFAVTGAGIRELDHATAWDPHHRAWLGRNYFRLEQGTGHCDEPDPTSAPRAVAHGMPGSGASPR